LKTKRLEEGKKKEAVENLEKCLKLHSIALLTLGEWTVTRSTPYTYYDR